MNKPGFYFSLLTAKTLYVFLRLTKISAGTSVIGKLVLVLCPDFLKYADGYIGLKINVTGTNGKTTTSGIISHLIKNNGASVINNALGANMLTGVVNAVSTLLNPLKGADYSVIESDEAYLSKIYDKFGADYLVVTNLFRDQLDRYGELAATKRLIQEGINKKPALRLILNADDPLVASFDGGKKIYYGVENVCYADESLRVVSHTQEVFNCPCGKPLEYEKKFFAQQGHYYCDCGYKRPEVKYKADITLYRDCTLLRINGECFEVPLSGLYNAYNALAAISLCKELEIENIAQNIKSFKSVFGRSEIKYLRARGRNKKALIQLIKNPIGANEVLKTVDKNSNLLIVINDNYADGRDVSWLWDAEFEILRSAEKEIVVSGLRAPDMALRLKYAGVPAQKIKVMPDIKKAVDYISKTADNDITILPTYTALLQINKIKEFRSK